MILSGDNKKIMSLIDSLNQQAKDLIKGSLEIAYYSNGAYQYDTVMNMSAIERELAIDLINERLKARSKNPFLTF